LGDRIISDLPFLGGSVDAGSVIYRQRLAERSWELIKEHPFLGDQLALTKMEGLRQGQGIIDTVNTYAGVALDYGLIGLSIFVGFILTALFKAYRASKVIAQSDPDLALLGTSLTACIVGTLLMIANSSFMYGYEEMFYVLAGLATAYVRLCRLPERRAANDARGGRSQVLR
jgi:O-antigen ligase